MTISRRWWDKFKLYKWTSSIFIQIGQSQWHEQSRSQSHSHIECISGKANLLNATLESAEPMSSSIKFCLCLFLLSTIQIKSMCNWTSDWPFWSGLKMLMTSITCRNSPRQWIGHPLASTPIYQMGRISQVSYVQSLTPFDDLTIFHLDQFTTCAGYGLEAIALWGQGDWQSQVRFWSSVK